MAVQCRELRARAEEAEWKHRQAVSREASTARVDSALAQPGAVKAGPATKPPFRCAECPAPRITVVCQRPGHCFHAFYWHLCPVCAAG